MAMRERRYRKADFIRAPRRRAARRSTVTDLVNDDAAAHGQRRRSAVLPVCERPATARVVVRAGRLGGRRV